MTFKAEELRLATQLLSNADAHHESKGTERRRAAACIQELVSELDTLYQRWAAMTSERTEWKMRALDAEKKLAQETAG